jgi:hypothetical protein
MGECNSMRRGSYEAIFTLAIQKLSTMTGELFRFLLRAWGPFAQERHRI